MAAFESGRSDGNGALPVRRASGVSDGGTDGLAGAESPADLWLIPPRAPAGAAANIKQETEIVTLAINLCMASSCEGRALSSAMLPS